MWSILFIFLIISELSSDIIKLKDGTVLNGKIIKETDRNFKFSNSYGTFLIQKKKIRQKLITSSYKEDLKFYQKEGTKVKKQIVKKNYKAGLEIKNTEEKNSKSSKGDNNFPSCHNYLSLYLSYNRALGELGSIITNGIGIHLNYDLGLYVLMNYSPKWYIPNVKFETTFYYFFSGPSTATFFSAGAGPQWNFPVYHKNRGAFYFFFLPEMTAIWATSTNYNVRGLTFSIRSACGYRYPLRQINLLFQIQYLYVYDSGLPLHSIGLSAGAGYLF